MAERFAAPLAWSLWMLSVACAALGLLFVYLNGSFSNLLDDSEGIDLVAAVAFPTVGAVIAARRPGNAIGWLFCAIGLLQGVTVLGAEYGIYALVTQPGLPAGRISIWFGTWAWLPSLILTGTFLLLLFPDGRLPSPRWRPVAWTAAVLVVSSTVILATAPWDLLQAGVPAENPFGIGSAWTVFEAAAFPMFAVGMVLAFLSVYSVIMRYRHAEGEQRQQLKWFGYAGALSITVLLFPPITPAVGDALTILQIAAILLLPAATGVAILRHRLYDIDAVINRTLVYGALTASLALVYFGSVAALQYTFRALTGGDSQLGIVASTLAVAALFNPLRRRIQGFIDRRFYRRKYDAAKTLEAFAARLRDEVDVDHLSEEFVAVIRRTMQPAHASLWLRGSTPSFRGSVPGEAREEGG